MELPIQLTYNAELDREENNQTEFKAVQQSKHPVDAISRYAKEYINAFLNSHGGEIWFGIEDNSEIKGIMLSEKLREQVMEAIDGSVAAFVPQVDKSLYSVSFIPVITTNTDFEPPVDYSVDSQNSSRFCNQLSGEQAQLLVVVVSVIAGNAPVYYASKQSDVAFFRRDGGITKMTPDTIIERVEEGRTAQGIKAMTDELDFTCRKKTISECIDYFKQKNPLTKILILYGLVSVGKSRFADHLKQIIQSDREEFPERRKAFSVNLKGLAGEKFKNFTDVLIELIHSMKPELELNYGVEEESNEDTSAEQLDSDAIEARLEAYEQQTAEDRILNVYEELLAELQPLMLIFDNAGNCPYIQSLLPEEVDAYVILISRTDMSFRNPTPFESFRRVSLHPLSNDEGAILIMSILGISVEEGRNISKLCAGLPQVIRLICKNCKMYGIPPMQVLLRLNKASPGSYLQRVQPQLYGILSGLEPEMLETLAAVSIFPGEFQDEAAMRLLGECPPAASAQQRFEQLAHLGLVDRVSQPCEGLRRQNWWRITEAIREFAYNNIDKLLILPVLEEYIKFFTGLLAALNDQLNLDYSNRSRIFRKASDEEIIKGTYSLFIVYSRAFSVLLHALNLFLEDPRADVRKIARIAAPRIFENAKPFGNFFTQQFCQEMQRLHALFKSKGEGKKAAMLDPDLDFAMWRRLYE